ncbi:unnamed protein product [Schistocephalus solidus]|uniref:MFS transporter n=1 Tax=Schistocephalus solidus TaxID=70667 RepID=A0A183SQE7_SCHSO|nr:unnamed protein product [Schistocephalus solidus]
MSTRLPECAVDAGKFSGNSQMPIQQSPDVVTGPLNPPDFCQPYTALTIALNQYSVLTPWIIEGVQISAGTPIKNSVSLGTAVLLGFVFPHRRTSG